MEVEWLGSAAFRITGTGGSFAVDPWIEGNPGVPYRIDELVGLHDVVVSHGHAEHFGRTWDAVRIAGHNGVAFVASPMLCAYVDANAAAAGYPVPVLRPISSGVAVMLAAGPLITPLRIEHPPTDDADLGPAPGQPNFGFVFEADGTRIVHIGSGLPGPVFEKIRERGPIDLALLPGWRPESSESRTEALALLRTMVTILRPRAVFAHAPWDPANPFTMDVKADFARSGEEATVLSGPPGSRFTVDPTYEVAQ